MEFDVLLTPAEFEPWSRRDLGGTACVVFDVLRATTTALVALTAGARAVVPVRTIEEALAERRCDPECLLAGEREGLRLTAVATGGVDFDLGNSPREFTRERVADRTIVTTTTNGTRAIRASARAAWVGLGAFLNVGALVRELARRSPPRVVLVCSGTGEASAYEDVMAAGALVARWMETARAARLSDAAALALGAWRDGGSSTDTIPERASNARRLMAFPELAPDVAYCLRLDVVDAVPTLRDGRELRLGE